MMRRHKEQGLSLVEVLVAMSILSVLGLAVAQSTIKSYVFLKRSIRASIATQLALDKIELLSAVDPATLTSASGGEETGLVRDGVKFNRTTTIVVNEDGSKTATVSVAAAGGIGGRAQMSTTFLERGNT